MTAFTVAAAQYPIGRFAEWGDYAAKLEAWVADAAGKGAKLALFPEYGAMELASLEPETMSDLAGSMAFVASLEDRVGDLHRELATRYGLHILAASQPVRRGGDYRNAAWLFAPSGAAGVQEKLVMTRFEREEWGVSAGGPLRLFETELGRIGVLICYDCEFPLLGRALAEAGAELILVPSCTDTPAGYHRVRIGARARALEGQCYAVQSPTVGNADWSLAVDENRGAAGIYGPPDQGFPDSGVVTMGEMDLPGWVLGEVNLPLVARVRAAGSVLNVAHWEEQPGAGPLPEVEVIAL